MWGAEGSRLRGLRAPVGPCRWGGGALQRDGTPRDRTSPAVAGTPREVVPMGASKPLTVSRGLPTRDGAAGRGRQCRRGGG